MTLSKSLRANTLPSSISLSSIQNQQSSPSSSCFDPDTPPRNTPRRKPSYDFFPLRSRTSPQRTSHRAVKHDIKGGLPEEPLQPSTPSQAANNNNHNNNKSRKWGERFSSLLPVLTSPTTDSPTTSVLRKPVPLLSPAMPPPTESPPPPPYKEHDARQSPDVEALDTPVTTDSERGPSPPALSGSDFLLSSSSNSITMLPAFQFEFPQSVTMPILQSEVQHSPLGIDQHPQIASIEGPLTASSSEGHLSPLQEPAAEIPPDRHGSIDEGTDELRGPRKLRKNSPSTARPRANSYQAGPSIPVPGIRPSATMPVAEARGRSVSSHPTLSVTEISAPPSMPPPPIPRPNSRVSSPKSATQSPSRGRIRKSWMPGGRSRSNSVEVSSPAMKMQAWVMTEESTSEYNPSFLTNADKVTTYSKLYKPLFRYQG